MPSQYIVICQHCKQETVRIKSLAVKKTFCELCGGFLSATKARGSDKKYSIDTCPQPETWFANGGRCGWAQECAHCRDNEK